MLGIAPRARTSQQTPATYLWKELWLHGAGNRSCSKGDPQGFNERAQRIQPREAQPYPTVGPNLKTINSWLESDKTCCEESAPCISKDLSKGSYRRRILRE